MIDKQLIQEKNQILKEELGLSLLVTLCFYMFFRLWARAVHK